MGIPNLSVFFPVDILGCPPAEISGFTLNAIFADVFNCSAIFATVSNSSIDSTLNCSILFFKAKAISSLVLPTPEYTILLLEIPALSVFFNSPIDTTSAPAPHFAKVFKTERFEFAFTEYAIRKLIPFWDLHQICFYLRSNITIFRHFYSLVPGLM